VSRIDQWFGIDQGDRINQLWWIGLIRDCGKDRSVWEERLDQGGQVRLMSMGG
jgi:hypothetical protein